MHKKKISPPHPTPPSPRVAEPKKFCVQGRGEKKVGNHRYMELVLWEITRCTISWRSIMKNYCGEVLSSIVV